jgi:hypothetical protein
VPEDQVARPCPVCDLKRNPLKCYYAFPGLAPDSFKPREHVQERAEDNLKKRDVIDQIRKIKNKKQKLDTGEESRSS